MALEVDKEVNLLGGVTFAEGVSLEKVELEQEGKRTLIADPSHFVPQTPGACNIILTVRKIGTATEVKVDNLTIKPLQYQSMSITNIKPVEILPIIGQVESGDKNVYSHIEHLRIAEATRIRDMMWKYGAGNYSPEQYQQLMKRLNVGMLLEIPK